MNADLVLHNANIYTVDPNHPWAEAVACANGRIMAVGNKEKILALAGPQTQHIDAGGCLVLPGLIDAHVHFLSYAVRRQQVNLFGLRQFDEVRRRVAAAVATAGPGQWVQGWGWDENSWDIQPERDWLTQLAPRTPVVLARLDMHTWWVNRAALERAGVSRDTPDPPESCLERDAAGDPTGILREWNAIDLIGKHIPSPDAVTLTKWLREIIAESHQLGLTGIHDQRVEREGQQSFQLLQGLDRAGDLALRVHMNLAADYITEAHSIGLQPGFGNDRLWLGHLKAFADGTLGSRTAHMLAPFDGEPNNYGIAVTSADELGQLALQADQAGFSLSVHAIGDRAVREVIDVLSEFPRQPAAPGATLPHRIEHVQLIDPSDFPRLHQHGIVASVQPVHIMLDWRTADRNWGRRARTAYAFQSLLKHGTILAFGSDAPVAPLNPLLGIHAGVTRQDEHAEPAGGWYPTERLSVADMVKGYTMGPAYLAGKQYRQGSLTPGKWADMIVLSHNIFEIPADHIKETTVRLTIFDGQIVYQAKGLS